MNGPAKGFWPAALLFALSACNQPLQDNFDIAGLWCEGADGVCQEDENQHYKLYLFSRQALPENPNIKYYAKIDQSPVEQLARGQDGAYYSLDQLAAQINAQLEI